VGTFVAAYGEDLMAADKRCAPLPLVPGDVLLIYAGILIASGGLSPWLFIPLAIAAATGGALLGYSWTRFLGAPGLRALASRLGMAARLERLERRVRSSGPPVSSWPGSSFRGCA
jgi:membrane protein DedA with SNARE-associated domain